MSDSEDHGGTADDIVYSDKQPGKGWVPSSRLREETQRKTELYNKVATLEQQIANMQTSAADLEKRAGLVDSLKDEIKGLKGQLTSKEAAWAEERGIYQSGVTDPEAIDLARYFHGRINEAERPAFVDWLTGIKAGEVEAPKALQPYFAAPEPKGEAKVEAKPDEAPPPEQEQPPEQRPGSHLPKRADGQALPPGGPGSTGGYSAEQIEAAKRKGLQTGDWSDWKAIRGEALRRA